MYIMSKARSMYAGSSGYNYGANKNSPGNGNGKWQGLWPSVGHARNARYINTRAGGDNRDVVFCMNQLGGVGRKSNMFATTADGVKEPCPGAGRANAWWFNNSAVLAALRTVRDFVLNNSVLNSNPSNPDVSVVFIGDHETLKTDHVLTHDGHDHNDPSWLFEPLHPITSSSEVNSAIIFLNSIKLQFDVNGEMQLHVVGIAGNKAKKALREKGYNRPFLIGDSTVVTAFGDGKLCAIGRYLLGPIEDGSNVGDVIPPFQTPNTPECYFGGCLVVDDGFHLAGLKDDDGKLVCRDKVNGCVQCTTQPCDFLSGNCR